MPWGICSGEYVELYAYPDFEVVDQGEDAGCGDEEICFMKKSGEFLQFIRPMLDQDVVFDWSDKMRRVVRKTIEELE
jgi:hypothetical protein